MRLVQFINTYLVKLIKQADLKLAVLDTNTEKDILKIKHPFKFGATFEFKTQW